MKFSMDNFKKWINEHSNDMPSYEVNSYIGIMVESKIDYNELLLKMLDVDNEDSESIAQEFIDNGGKVKSVNGKIFYVETSNGDVFAVNRKYLIRA